MDNAPIYTSKALQAKIPYWRENKLEIFWLPTYSPQLNLIEILWLFMMKLTPTQVGTIYSNM
jgi:transposase